MAENNIFTGGDTSGTASYLSGLNAATRPVYRYPEDLGAGGSVETTPFVIFAPYKRRQQMYSVNPKTTLDELPTPSFNIVLPLPSSALKTSYGVEYKPVELGAALAGQVQQFSRGGSSSGNITEFFNSIRSGVIAQTAGKVLEGLASGVVQKIEDEAIDGISTLAFGDHESLKESIFGLAGQRHNPFTENLFRNVNFREHTFNYTFIPRSYKESVRVDEIVRLLRFFMLPAYGDAGVLGQVQKLANDLADIPKIEGSVLNFPYEFQILYSVHNTTFMLLPSVLTDMNVDYSGGTDAPQFFTARGVSGSGKNYPAKITVEMKFREMMILTRNRAEASAEGSEDVEEVDTRDGATSGYRRFRF